jgi:hypothetical protein
MKKSDFFICKYREEDKSKELQNSKVSALLVLKKKISNCSRNPSNVLIKKVKS